MLTYNLREEINVLQKEDCQVCKVILSELFHQSTFKAKRELTCRVTEIQETVSANSIRQIPRCASKLQ